MDDKNEFDDHLLYSIMKEQTNTIHAAASEGINQLQSCVQSILNCPDWKMERDIQSAIMVDYYVAAMWWAAKEENFTSEQISAFFALLQSLLNDIKADVSLEDNLIAIKTMSISASTPEMPKWATAGALYNVFSVDQIHSIFAYLCATVFQHYRLYKYYMQPHDFRIIRTTLTFDLLEMKPTSSLPPLCEAVTEDQYCRLINVSPEDQRAAKERAREVAEDDVIAKLAPDVVCQIIHSVFDEMLPRFEEDVRAALRQTENAMIARLNKIYIVN